MEPLRKRYVRSEDCGCRGVCFDGSYTQQGRDDARIVVCSMETGAAESPGEPGTGSGKLAKRRSWPSDF